MSKKLIHNRVVQTITAFLIASYIRLVRITSKTLYINIDRLNKIQEKESNLIFACWHGRELMLTSYLSKLGQMFSVVSLHNDGNMVTKVLESFN